VATEALKRTVTAVFGDLEGVKRIKADIDNATSRRALEKAEFQREAVHVLRSYCVVKGRLRDMVIYSFISIAAYKRMNQSLM
jgi:RimJ/RimL family protein N-acetyltransferase